MQIIKKSKIPQCLISTCVHVNANVLSKAPAIQKFYKTSINKKKYLKFFQDLLHALLTMPQGFLSLRQKSQCH